MLPRKSPNSKVSLQVEEFDIGDEMKSAAIRTWMMKKDPEIDPGKFFSLLFIAYPVHL